jgi:hypothetical protein
VCYIHAKHAQADRMGSHSPERAHTSHNQFSRATQFAFFPYSAAATVKFSQDEIAAEAEKMHIFHRQERLGDKTILEFEFFILLLHIFALQNIMKIF